MFFQYDNRTQHLSFQLAKFPVQEFIPAPFTAQWPNSGHKEDHTLKVTLQRLHPLQSAPHPMSNHSNGMSIAAPHNVLSSRATRIFDTQSYQVLQDQDRPHHHPIQNQGYHFWISCHAREPYPGLNLQKNNSQVTSTSWPSLYGLQQKNDQKLEQGT